MRPGDAACPVCALPVGQAPVCECDWRLQTAWTAGGVDRAAFDARLAAARLTHDLRAVARIGADWEPYAHLLRGKPSDADWAAAKQHPRGREKRLYPVLTAAFDALPEGGVLAVAEVGAEGIAVNLVNATDLDRPGECGSRRVSSWSDVLPQLSREPDRLRFQLAGGLDGVDRGALDERLTAWTAELLPPAAVLVAVCRNPGWTVPEQVVKLLGVRHTASEEGEVRPTLANAIAEQPLRARYGLLTAEVRDSVVTLVPQPVFEPGDRPGRSVTISVRCPPGGIDHDTTLAIVAPGPRPIATWSARLRPGAPVPIEVRLDGPGRVQLVSPVGRATDSGDLAELIRRSPPRLDVHTEPVDLICLLELNGLPDVVARRRRLLSGLLELIAADLPLPPSVAVYGYADHFVRGVDRVVHGRWLAPVSKARDALDALPPAAARWHQHAAPLEDALHEVWLQCEGRVALRRRVLLVVAGREPHPMAVRDVPRPAQACPHNHDWAASVTRLAGAGVARRLVVLDRVPGETSVWRHLGSDYLNTLDETTPRRLAVAMSLISADKISYPFPLADTPVRCP
jgi:hypothetical protein